MKVWLYYRLSRDEDKELNSLSNQRNIIYHYAITNGHEVVGESFDDNVSGMHFNRPGIDRIYEVVEAGEIEAVVVKDIVHRPLCLSTICGNTMFECSPQRKISTPLMRRMILSLDSRGWSMTSMLGTAADESAQDIARSKKRALS